MASKLFVGSLSWNTDEKGLEQAFEKFGSIVEAKIITDRSSGRSRGFGFVTFSNPDEAKVAAREMNGAELDNRTIKVDFAQDKPRKDNRRPSSPRARW